MRLYQCDVSGPPLYFANHFSVGANNARVGFVADTLTLHTLTEAGNSLYSIASRPNELFRFCANEMVDGSNWLVSADDPNRLAIPARYNRVIPNTDTPQGIDRFQKIGAAQRHLFYSILHFGIPCPDRTLDPTAGRCFCGSRTGRIGHHPRSGGVGPMTIAMLKANTVIAAFRTAGQNPSPSLNDGRFHVSGERRREFTLYGMPVCRKRDYLSEA